MQPSLACMLCGIRHLLVTIWKYVKSKASRRKQLCCWLSLCRFSVRNRRCFPSVAKEGLRKVFSMLPLLGDTVWSNTPLNARWVKLVLEINGKPWGSTFIYSNRHIHVSDRLDQLLGPWNSTSELQMGVCIMCICLYAEVISTGKFTKMT